MVLIMRSINSSFYNSKDWHECRKAYLKSVNSLCERCLSKGLYIPAQIVHHKIYLTEENYGDLELMLNFENLEALCLACHNEEHYKKRNKKRWKFVEGQLITGEAPPVSIKN